MIEEVGRVIAVETGIAWVEVERKAACGHCMASGGCGTAVMAKLFANRSSQVRVEDTLGVTVGDAVVLGIREDALLHASFQVYGVPLLALVAAAVGAAALGVGDGLCMFAALTGLAGGLILTRHVTDWGDRSRYAPVLLARHKREALSRGTELRRNAEP